MPEVIEEDVMERARKNISGEKEKYYSFLVKSCRQLKNKLNLLDPKQARPKDFKKVVRAIASTNEIDYGEYDE